MLHQLRSLLARSAQERREEVASREEPGEVVRVALEQRVQLVSHSASPLPRRR